ncbi:MAG: hypothetical protein Q8L29_01375 [archaeon]|nr:hypothetical protein [archaeon]
MEEGIVQNVKKGFIRRHWFLIVFLILLVLCGLIYYTLFYKTYNVQSETSGQSVNPVSDLSVEEAVIQFNSGFVSYLLYNIGAWQLHNPPLSSDTPKIEIDVGDEIYNAVVEKGNINVQKGKIDSKDIIIILTKEEAVKMMKDSNYVKESFKSGGSRIELVAGETTLFLKGYLKLYNELSDEN